MSSLTALFVGAHVLLAERTGIEELALTMPEGEQFMGAAQNVMRHYSTGTNQKTVDWLAFIGVASYMYVPRFIAIRNRKASNPSMPAPLSTSIPGQEHVIRPDFGQHHAAE